MSIRRELTTVYQQLNQLQHGFGRVQNGPDAPPQICALAEKLAEQTRALTLLVQRIAIDLKFPLDPIVPDIGAGCDDPSRIADADHIRRLELEEVADGAYGNGPLTRGAARRRLHDFGQGSHEQSFDRTQPMIVPEVLDPATGRAVAAALTAPYLTPKERGYIDWAIRSSVEAQDSGPPEMLDDAEIADLLAHLRDGPSDQTHEGEPHVPA